MERFGVAISRVKTNDFDTKVKIFLECAKSLLQTLYQIHEAGYIHGDVNPENVLIDIKNNMILGVKICDFAFCRKIDSLDKQVIGLANWISPPEYYATGIENLSSMDIYHAVLVLHSILAEEENYSKEEVLTNKPQ